jgi:hypothetical protein
VKDLQLLRLHEAVSKSLLSALPVELSPRFYPRSSNLGSTKLV